LISVWDRKAFFFRQRDGVKEGLERRLSKAPFALMRPDLVELAHPEIEVGLQVLDGGVDLLAEGDAIELVEDGLVEALDDAVIRYEIRRRLAVRLFPEGKRQYGEPIRDTGRREHEGAGRPPIDSGPRARARYMAAPCDFPGCAVSADQ
jgi:hypothetical protein